MFNPSRLELARKRRRLTGKQLAERAGISPITVSRICNGKNEPDPESVKQIAKALSFPLPYFYGDELDELNESGASFRSLSKLSARNKGAALAAGAFAYHFDDWVNAHFNLPSPDLIDMSAEPDAPSAARALRQHWGLGEKPVGNIVRLLESKGVRVFSLFENTKDVDAFSSWRDDTPYMFLNTMKSAERSRFDAAHELGHLVLHKHGGTGGRNNRDAEMEANDFASSFLMPSEDVLARFPFVASFDHLIQGKKRWGVSVAALAYRLHRLGRLSDWRYRQVCIEINRRRFHINEPEGITREESIVWNKVLGVLWSEKITKSHIARELMLPVEEIENLLNGLVGSPSASVVEASGTVETRKLRLV